ncbi:MAG: hypothetical protein AAF564_20915 [Bacteroidota bacterium]
MPISTKNLTPVHLSFAVLYPIHEAIAEIQVKKDIELCLQCVDEFHEALRKSFAGQVGVLVNRVHPYSYDSNAQFKITTSPQIKAIGIVHHNTTSWVASHTMQELPPNRVRNMRNFWQRDDAIEWLLGEMQQKG